MLPKSLRVTDADMAIAMGLSKVHLPLSWVSSLMSWEFMCTHEQANAVLHGGAFQSCRNA